jgi:uncharacterized protein DUF6166
MKEQAIYTGSRASGKVAVNREGKTKYLDPRFDLRNHSPTGFAWGYGGSGPGQLALAILADYFGSCEIGDILACHLYQDLKWQLIAHLAIEKDFTVTSKEIHAQLRGIWKADKEGNIAGWLDQELRSKAFETAIREEQNREGDPRECDAREEAIYIEDRKVADELIRELVL